MRSRLPRYVLPMPHAPAARYLDVGIRVVPRAGEALPTQELLASYLPTTPGEPIQAWKSCGPAGMVRPFLEHDAEGHARSALYGGVRVLGALQHCIPFLDCNLLWEE